MFMHLLYPRHSDKYGGWIVEASWFFSLGLWHLIFRLRSQNCKSIVCVVLRCPGCGTVRSPGTLIYYSVLRGLQTMSSLSIGKMTLFLSLKLPLSEDKKRKTKVEHEQSFRNPPAPPPRGGGHWALLVMADVSQLLGVSREGTCWAWVPKFCKL